MRFRTVTLGCKVNQYETQYVRSALLLNGHQEVLTSTGSTEVAGANLASQTPETGFFEKTPKIFLEKHQESVAQINKIAQHNKNVQLDKAAQYDKSVQLDKTAHHEREVQHDKEEGATDLVVINTCSVTAESDAKSRKAISHWAKKCPNAKILVMGCFASAQPEKAASLPSVAYVLQDKRQLDSFLTEHLGLRILPLGIDHFSERHRAYVKIQDGCRVGCAYCIIPHVRPYLQSRLPSPILHEMRQLLQNGYRELVLTGIHLGHYGLDFGFSQNESARWTLDDFLHAQKNERFDLASLLGQIVESLTASPSPDILKSMKDATSPGVVPFSMSQRAGEPAQQAEGLTQQAEGLDQQAEGLDQRIEAFEQMMNGQSIIDRPAVSFEQKTANWAQRAKTPPLVERLQYSWRLRLGSLEAVEVSDALLDVVASHPKEICPHFHLSMQSGDDSVLKRMRRRWSSEPFIEKCMKIRERIPLAALTTDVIVGFPGETDEQFLRTCEVVQKIGFSKIHVFRFSPRQGTAAATMDHQIAETVKKERAAHLISLATELRNQYAKKFLGRRVRVLLENVRHLSPSAEVFPWSRPENSEGLLCLTGTTDEYLPVSWIQPCPSSFSPGEVVELTISKIHDETLVPNDCNLSSIEYSI